MTAPRSPRRTLRHPAETDDDSHFIYVNFKEESPGIYEVSGYNTSGFSGKEAIAKYLDTAKAEAAEANKAASANAEM